MSKFKLAACSILAGLLIGAAAGAGGMLVAFPFIFPPQEVNETYAMAASSESEVVAEGMFAEDAPGQDSAHWGKGSFRVYAAPGDVYVLELQPDFKVGPGPNFWIYLSRRSGIGDEGDFREDKDRFKLAKLKSFSGSQVYEISKLDFESTEAITIWCESFSQYIASADLAGLGASS